MQEARELLKKALALPDKERADLAGSLIASLDATVDENAEAAWQEELVVSKKFYLERLRRFHGTKSGKRGRTLMNGK